MHCKTLLVLCLVAVAAVATAGEETDGVIARSTQPVPTYRVRAGIIDYTTLGGIGVQGTITIKRGKAFFTSGRVLANDSQPSFVGVKTTVPGRVYEVRCTYSGLTAIRYVQASIRNYEFNFKYSRDRFGRAYLTW